MGCQTSICGLYSYRICNTAIASIFRGSKCHRFVGIQLDTIECTLTKRYEFVQKLGIPKIDQNCNLDRKNDV
jgi:hypothetical protein